MTDYTIALFLHVVGALALFVAFGLESLGLRKLQRAAVDDELREWIRILGGLPRLGGPSMLALLITGFYMMATTWGWVPWIVVSLVAILIIGAVGSVVTGRQMAAIGRAAEAEIGPLSPELQDRLRRPHLLISHRTRMALAVGIVFMMTVKPALAGALMAVGVAVVAGIASSLPIMRRGRVLPEVTRQEAQ